MAKFWGCGAVVGFDTRQSSPHLAEGVRLGFAAAAEATGAGAATAAEATARTPAKTPFVWLGIAPTPAVAELAKSAGSVGIVVTASHNPHPDNGLKVFEPGGLKPSQATEAQLAELMLKAHTDEVVARIVSAAADSTPTPAESARTEPAPQHPADLSPYIRALCDSIAPDSLKGLRVAADCANGAMAAVVPQVLERLGINHTLLSAEPDGTNINQNCGSTFPEQMSQAASQPEYDFGFALDGDGDRVVVALSDGTLLDGDDMLAILTRSHIQAGKLADSKVVITPMTNLGLRQEFANWGTQTVEVPVGDRNVQRELLGGGWSLGGEQSGHIILADHAVSADGLLTALHVMAALRQDPQIWPAFAKVPQSLVNLETTQKPARLAELMQPEVAQMQTAHRDEARILVRASGTEGVLRIMVEARDGDLLDSISRRLVELARQLDS